MISWRSISHLGAEVFVNFHYFLVFLVDINDISFLRSTSHFHSLASHILDCWMFFLYLFIICNLLLESSFDWLSCRIEKCHKVVIFIEKWSGVKSFFIDNWSIYFCAFDLVSYSKCRKVSFLKNWMYRTSIPFFFERNCSNLHFVWKEFWIILHLFFLLHHSH